jgi:hypothetical protein
MARRGGYLGGGSIIHLRPQSGKKRNKLDISAEARQIEEKQAYIATTGILVPVNEYAPTGRAIKREEKFKRKAEKIF